MTKIKHFRVEISVELGMPSSDIYKEYRSAEKQICMEYDSWKENKRIISIDFGRTGGNYIEDDFSVYMHILYEEDN